MQTIAGTTLVRRLSPNYRILDVVSTILRFLGVGGPLACVVSSLIGVGSLWMFGIVSTENLPFSLCTWWAGDTIGVIIVAPLLMSILSHRAAFWPRRFLSIALPSVVAMAIVIVLFYKVSAWEQERVVFQFRETATRMIVRLPVCAGVVKVFPQNSVYMNCVPAIAVYLPFSCGAVDVPFFLF